MSVQSKMYIKILFVFQIFFTPIIVADSFSNIFYNNHGVVGLINMPSARFYDEEVHGISFYDGTPDQKITLSSSPYDWLEASFFYTNVQGVQYASFTDQDYKDKGFNIKLRLKEEGRLPALAIGLYDFAGTGLYASEYIVGSYGIKNIDLHFGLGWGRLNQESSGIKNPFSYLNDRFSERPKGFSGPGGQFEASKFFSGKKASPFYGFSYKYNNNLFFKFERDTTAKDVVTKLIYEDSKSDFSYGFDYLINKNFSLGASFERGNFLSLRFVYKNNPKISIMKYQYQELN